MSIIPRGIGALGYTIQRPTEDRFLMTRQELENKMAVLLGGRAAEHIVFGELSTGAADDLVKVTDIARSIVTRYGMTEELGQIVYERSQQSFLGGPQPMPYAPSAATARRRRARSTPRSRASSMRRSAARSTCCGRSARCWSAAPACCSSAKPSTRRTFVGAAQGAGGGRVERA